MKQSTASRPAGFWTRIGWPAVATPVAVTGLLSAAVQMGLVEFLAVFVTSLLLMGAFLWGLIQESPWLRPHVLKLCFAIPSALIVVVGWTLIAPSFGIAPPLLVGVLSPRVLGWLRRRTSRRRTVQKGLSPLGSQRLRFDQQLVDQRFAEIVRELENSDKRTGT